MLFVLPGYALTAAAFGRHTPEPTQRCALTVGLSLAVSILGALALNLTSYGLRDRSWSVFVVALVWTACAVAARQRSAGPPLAPDSDSRPRFHLRALDLLLVFVATGLTIAALTLAVTPLPAKNVQGYTALSMVRQQPPLDRSGPTRVAIEVVSNELEPTTYHLEVRSGSTLVFARSHLELSPGQRWRASVVIASTPPVQATQIVANLLRTDHATSRYRTVRVWLSPSGSR
jgi:uncharacterized membrane protein